MLSFLLFFSREVFNISELFEKIMDKKPLVHVITDALTLRDTVNAILSTGANAISANDIEEVKEVVRLSDALLLNIGTPSKNMLEAMCLAGSEANRRKIPVVLDPSGAGVSKFRTEILLKLVKHVSVNIIRGNFSEIYYLACVLLDREKELENFEAKYLKNPENIVIPKEMLQELSKKTASIIIATGKEDLISNESTTDIITGGSIYQSFINGNGCILSGLIAVALGTVKSKLEIEENNFFEIISDEAEDFEIAKQVLTAYSDAALEAEDEMLKSDINGTRTFYQFFMDKISKGL
ncbi:hydroxyethylthiazole kinase [Acetitomaculum ruminis DSM 5522]|uniref:hydroxyethylthiazole kinase n=2 Tax=Acetitomaculum ruminis TaxID=2382 RepID=A0A1I0ZW97_9FIRM|nr:hydroxyethylthiazole kinase [Acetitomaculum ruminis DSM 5522]